MSELVSRRMAPVAGRVVGVAHLTPDGELVVRVKPHEQPPRDCHTHPVPPKTPYEWHLEGLGLEYMGPLTSGQRAAYWRARQRAQHPWWSPRRWRHVTDAETLSALITGVTIVGLLGALRGLA
jgi:hypothetical protein